MSNHDDDSSVDSSTTGSVQEEVQSTPPKVTTSPPATYKTGINARIDEALKVAKRVNRSSDLVPLNHEYDLKKKELKSLIAAAKAYKASVEKMDMARINMAMKLATISDKSPIFAHVGTSAEQGGSFAAIAQTASKQTGDIAASYQDSVVAYLVEWEEIITSRVEQGLKETGKLKEKLQHYQTKIEGLRKTVNKKDDTPKGVPKKLQAQLDRNEKKLDHAWNEHERSASMLCNLMEQVTARGWKDLAPVVLNSVQWEVERTSGEQDIFAKLPAVAEAMMETVEANSSLEEVSCVKVALASEHSDVLSETVESDHEVDSSKMEQVPQSPDRVSDLNAACEV